MSLLAAGLALLVFLSGHWQMNGGAVGATVLKIAAGKAALPVWRAFFLGIMCNVLVCLAVWMTYSARSTVDKIMAIIFPITVFVAGGFEHSIANMYFIPIGLLIKEYDPLFVASTKLEINGLTWPTFFVNNLIPVTIGNIIGGAVLVAIIYWFVFLPHTSKEKT